MVVGSGPVVVALLILLAWPAARSSAQTLTVDSRGDSLRIVPQGFSFLKGDPLARLKDGQSVRVELTATVLPAPGGPEVATSRRIFSLSYDLWEERFAVTTVEKRPQSMTHLAQSAAESWCIDQLRIPVKALGTLGPDQPFWIRLEYRILDPDGSMGSGESGFTLQTLIDLLSRARKAAAAPQFIEAGPFKLTRGTSSPGTPLHARSRGPRTPLRSRELATLASQSHKRSELRTARPVASTLAAE